MINIQRDKDNFLSLNRGNDKKAEWWRDWKFSVIKIFWSIELNNLWSKKICRPKMIVWFGATFILRWSCSVIKKNIKNLVLFRNFTGSLRCFLFPVIFVGMRSEDFSRSKMQIQLGIARKTWKILEKRPNFLPGAEEDPLGIVQQWAQKSLCRGILRRQAMPNCRAIRQK